MTELKRHVFLVVALVFSATSYALSSENVAPNLDDGNSTLGQGRGSVHANEKVMDTLEEERAGGGEELVKLVEEVISPDTGAMAMAREQLADKKEEAQRVADVLEGTEPGHNLLAGATPASEAVEKVPRHPEAANELGPPIVGVTRKAPALEEKYKELKQQIEELMEEPGPSNQNGVNGFINKRGLNREEIVQRTLAIQLFGQEPFILHRARNMAVGSVYFESASKFTGEKTRSKKDAQKMVDWVLNMFRIGNVELDEAKVKSELLDLLSKEDSGLPDAVVQDMALGKIAYELLIKPKSVTPKKRKH